MQLSHTLGLPDAELRRYEGACGTAYNGRSLPGNFLLLREELTLEERTHLARRVISPFLVSKPPWLVGAAPAPPSPAWRDRKLIFFAGHIPKPSIRDTRYTLWRQLRNDPRATVLSPTLYCTVGGFSACRKDLTFLNQQNITFFTEFCRFACAGAQNLGGSGKMVYTACLGTNRKQEKYTPILKAELRDKCKHGFTGVNYENELADMNNLAQVELSCEVSLSKTS